MQINLEKMSYQDFKNRKYYDFGEIIEHGQNQNKFINKIVNKKKK